MPERCDVCGFEWDAITAEEVPGRLAAAAAGFQSVMHGDPDEIRRRPSPDVWSQAEYTSHVRDVMLNLRDRMIVGLAEDNPVPKAMFTDVRVDAGIYAADTPAMLEVEIGVAAGLLGRTVTALDAEQLARPIFYGWPVPATRSLLWVAAQALHEAEHHLADIR